MEAKESPFMLALCLEAHATPSPENDDSVPNNPPSTRQHPLTPAHTKRKKKKGEK